MTHISQISRSAIAGCFLVLPQAALAEQEAIELEPVQVIASRPAAPAAQRDQLRRADLDMAAARNVDDVLRQVPAFSLFRRSSSRVAHPTSQGVTLRGIAPSGVSRSLVLLDGLPLNDPFGGWVYWGRIPRASLEQIEITRGGVSSVWGSAALSGLVDIRTRQEAGTELSLAGGNHGEEDAELASVLTAANNTVRLQARYRDSDGYQQLAEGQRGSIDEPARARQQVARVGYDHRFDGSEWRLRLGAYDEERGNGTALTGNQTQTLDASSTLSWGAPESAWTWQLLGQDQDFANRFSAQAADRNSETPALDQFDLPSRSVASALNWSSRTATAQRAAGLDARWIDGETNERFFFRDGQFLRQREAGAEQLLIGGYLHTAWMQEGWQLASSFRLDYWHLQDARRLETNLESGESQLEQRFGNRDELAISPRLDLSRSLSDSTELRLAAYRSFRAPTINELVRPFRVRNDITAANAELDAEYLHGVEAGLDWRHERALLRMTAYWNRLDDAIANITVGAGPGQVAPCGFVPDGGSCRQRQNLDQIRAIGLEASAELSLGSALSLRAGALYSRNTIEEGPAAIRGNDVPQVPDLNLSAQLRYTGRVSAELGWRYADRQFEDDQNQRELGSLTTLDASLRIPIARGWSLFANAENLLDRINEVGRTANGLLTIGAPRLVSVGIRWSTP